MSVNQKKEKAGGKKKSKHSKRTYYVVTAGRQIGIYRDKKKHLNRYMAIQTIESRR